AGQQVLAARALAAAALDETRVAIAGLRPTVLDDLGLAAGLESLARTLPGVDVELAIDEQVELADHQEIAVYRIAQEALQNIMKHAEADHVWLTLSATGSAVELEVRDDGRGFRSDGADGAGERASYGLSGMRERADLIDADLQIRSAEGKGTIVLVTIPG
ncbi:MAG: ATP-binding protein, partial [Actinomycetota bacterium]